MGQGDDVIRIRIDTTWAMLDFIRLLAAQAAEGETRAPANPAQTAIFRELAPYRLVEYDYVDPGIGTVESVLVGFPNGALFAAGEDIPEAEVGDLIVNHVDDEPVLPAIYVYVVLSHPASPEAISDYLDALSNHLGQPVVAAARVDGTLAAFIHGASENGDGFGRLRAAAAHCAAESARHLDKARLTNAFAANCQRADGIAYARLTYAYDSHVLEFAGPDERNDFLSWSRQLCRWLDTQPGSAEDLGFPEATRPAQIARVPEDDIPVARLAPPSSFGGGKAWKAFAEGAPPGAEQGARDYWAYVRETLEAMAGE
ncbi:MAG: hypothetical protein ACM31L_12965 [Actinomycetota bacterium]